MSKSQRTLIYGRIESASYHYWMAVYGGLSDGRRTYCYARLRTLMQLAIDLELDQAEINAAACSGQVRAQELFPDGEEVQA